MRLGNLDVRWEKQTMRIGGHFDPESLVKLEKFVEEVRPRFMDVLALSFGKSIGVNAFAQMVVQNRFVVVNASPELKKTIVSADAAGVVKFARH